MLNNHALSCTLSAMSIRMENARIMLTASSFCHYSMNESVTQGYDRAFGYPQMWWPVFFQGLTWRKVLSPSPRPRSMSNSWFFVPGAWASTMALTNHASRRFSGTTTISGLKATGSNITRAGCIQNIVSYVRHPSDTYGMTTEETALFGMPYSS